MTTASPVTLLFVPGHRESMLRRARQSNADAIVFDLEDSVPPAQKDAARSLVAATLESWDDTLPRAFVRVNPPRFRMARDDAAVMPASDHVGIVVPKIDVPMELDSLADQPEFRRSPMIVTIETPRSLLGALEIASHRSVCGLCLGGEDLAMNLGMERTLESREFDAARFQMLVAARAAEVWALDVICPEFRDLDVVRRDAERAAAMGLDGKFAIHPAQLDPIRAAFTPSEEELEHARRIVDAYDDAVAEGHGAVNVDGQMIDPPVAERFRTLLSRAGGT